MINVTKRNGSIDKFDVSKIRKMTTIATQGLNVSPLELESNIHETFKNNVKTSDINEILISACSKLTSIESPDWIYAGGRIVMHDLQREVFKHTKVDYAQTEKTFYDYIQQMVKQKSYKQDLLSYSKDEIDSLAKCIKPKYDLNYTIGGALSLKKKYLHKNGNKTLELPQYADMVSAMLLNVHEKEDRVGKVKVQYDLIGSRVLSLATPLKSNLRKPNGSTSSCFIIPMDDSIESIMKTYKDIAYISKAGGGVGVYISKIRPSLSMLLGQPVSNNVCLWIKIINDIAVAVNQAGVRKGAVTPALDMWHKDIEDFVEIKTEVGELRLKSFDVFPQVVVRNLLLKRVKNNESFWTVDRHEIMTKGQKYLGEVIDLTELTEDEFNEWYPKIEALYDKGTLTNGHKHNAKAFWKKYLEVYIETGDLYMFNVDNANKHNPMNGKEQIYCGNLCQESFSPMTPSTDFETFEDELGFAGERWKTGRSHTCDLLSINLAEILNDEQLLERACRQGVRILDNSMDVTKTPISESNKHNVYYRTIGVGTLGTADWMAYNKLSYNKPEDWVELEKLYEKMSYWCFDESCNLAKEKGSFIAFDQTTMKDGILLGKTGKELDKQSVAGLDWSALCEKAKNGMRNLLTFSIAPNTSTSVLVGASASYLPIYSKFNYESMANLSVPIIPKFIKSRFWYYNESFTVPTENIIKGTTKIQKWIDTGISMELIINPEITSIKKISDALLEAFNEGLKTVYYSRTLDLSNTNEKEEKGCVSCAN